MKGAKAIIIILFALFFGSLLLVVAINNSKQELIKQYSQKENELRKKADDLFAQISNIQSEKKRLEDKLSTIKKDMDEISTDRDSWKGKYELVLKEKEDLVSKLQTTPKAAREGATLAAPTDEAHWAGVLKEKAGLELQLSDLKSRLSDASIQVEEVKKTKAEIEVEITKLKQSNEDLERKIKYTTDLSNNLALDLAKEKNDKKSIEDKLSKLKEENLSLRYQIKDLATSKVSLERGLQRLVVEKDKLNKRLQETDILVRRRIDEVLDIKKDLEGRLKGQAATAAESKSIELAPIVVRSSTSSKGIMLPADLIGKVVSVNEANNFVIIDLGENSGVKAGDSLKVYRDNKQIASIEVIQTRKDISAADIKQKSQPLQIGDLVK